MLIISELMKKNIVTLSSEGTVLEATKLMKEHKIGAILIKEKDNAVGIFTERDVLTRLDFNDTQTLPSIKMKDVMTKNLRMVGHQDPYTRVIDLMREQRIRHALVEQNGQVVGIVSFRDLITHYDDHLKSLLERNHKQLLETLNKVKKSEAALEKVLDARTEFTNKVSHELRTPLASIKGAVDIVIRSKAGPVTNDQIDILGKANSNIDRMKRLLDDILDLSKLESGAVKLNIQPHDINKIIAEVVESQEVILNQKGLTLKFEFDSKVPQVPFDLDGISQVLCNLINNATKFTEAGGITVSTLYHPEKTQVEVCIRDTGRGIHEQDISKLFGKFQQLRDRSIPQIGGTGLGLAICKEIILQHAGEIWAESQWEKGSAFHFTLPIQQGE